MVKVPFIKYTEYPKNCPIHQEIPFAFKFFCIQECIDMGYKNILWLDSSVIIKNTLSDVFDKIEKNGYFFIKNWHSIGSYCHDKALETLKITREQSFMIPCIQGGNFGLNFEKQSSIQFIERMFQYINDGITFPGPYSNKERLASNDDRVLGHRHDQIAMSIEALRLNMNLWEPSETNWFIHDWNFVKGNVNSTVIDVNMRK
jgi:hypothetical protein